MGCPRCLAPMVSDGQRMVCADVQCKYQYDLVKKLPTYDDLFKENEQLKVHIKELEDLVDEQNNEAIFGEGF